MRFVGNTTKQIRFFTIWPKQKTQEHYKLTLIQHLMLHAKMQYLDAPNRFKSIPCSA
nr:MAG TPA: hypothetical protein [Caudoviricetes sp.]